MMYPFHLVVPRGSRRYKLAVLYQMTAPGIPSVFYGDEVGLEGIDENDYRQPMRWDLVGGDLTAYYRTVIGLRRRLSALTTGNYRTILVDQVKDIYGFMRENGEERVYVLLNNSEIGQTIELACTGKQSLADLLNNREHPVTNGMVKIELPPVSGAVLA